MIRLLATLLIALACTPALALADGSAATIPGTQPAPTAAKAASKDFTYGDLLHAVDAREVRAVKFTPVSSSAKVTLRNGATHTVHTIPGDDLDLARRLAAQPGVQVDVNGTAATHGPGPAAWQLALIALVLAVATIGTFLTMRRGKRGGGPMFAGGPDMGPKPGETKPAERPNVDFSDVAGCEEAVEEVSELVEFLRSPERFDALGARMPSGTILYGPPGTGKTLLAKALAGEADVPFFAASGSEFMEMFVGLGAKRVRDLFRDARKAAPCVVFIDEIDAVGGKRSGSADGGSREADNTLNQLLTELDGFGGRDGVVVVAATNRLDTLDEALLRPGRFARQIQVSPPDEQGRLDILKVHATGKPLADDADLEKIAAITAGFSGAQLSDLLNEAAIWAARNDRAEITSEDLWEGLCRAVAGPRKVRAMMAEGEREIVAYHEAGHVLAGELCPSQDRTEHATINPRGRALGFALKGSTDRGLQNEQHLHEALIVILGGRAAEYVKYGTVSSGAANDLQQANLMARRAVEEWGLSGRVGQLSRAGGVLSGATQAKVDEEIARMVADAYTDAVELVESHLEQLEALAAVLIDRGDIGREEIELAVRGASVTARRPRQAHSPRSQETESPAAGPVRLPLPLAGAHALASVVRAILP